MNIPSLVVLLIGGWSDAPAGQSDPLEGMKQGFLHDQVSSYPSVLLPELKGGLIEFYSDLGAIPASKASLPAVLDSHRIRVVTIAGPDRYGLLVRTLRGGSEGVLDHEQRHYISLPPGETLADSPESNIPEVVQQAEDVLRFSRDTVFFIALDAMWSMLAYQDPALYRQAAKQVQSAAQKIIRKCLENGQRILVVSDSSSVVGKKDSSSPAALPAVLIDAELEGRRSGHGDYVGFHASGQAFQYTGKDLSSTVLRLMQIPAPGEGVFSDCLPYLV